MKGKLYYTHIDSKTGEEFAYYLPYYDGAKDWSQQSRENAINHVSRDYKGDIFPHFGRIIDKAEYDRIHMEQARKRMNPTLSTIDFCGNTNGSIEPLMFVYAVMMNNDNVYSRRAWEEHTGVKLDKAWKRRESQLADYYGEAWTAMLAARKAKADAKKAERAEEIAKRKAEEVKGIMAKIKNQESISGEEFVKACDALNIELHIRTRGFALKSLADINVLTGSSHVWIKRGKKRPRSEKFWDAVHEIRKAIAA